MSQYWLFMSDYQGWIFWKVSFSANLETFKINGNGIKKLLEIFKYRNFAVDFSSILLFLSTLQKKIAFFQRFKNQCFYIQIFLVIFWRLNFGSLKQDSKLLFWINLKKIHFWKCFVILNFEYLKLGNSTVDFLKN